jgi:YD repeat-containing protein
VNRPDRKAYVYTYTNGKWVSDADVNERLIRLTDANNATAGWEIVTGDGMVEHYSPAGTNLFHQHRSGLTQKVTKLSSSLTAITDQYGRTLLLDYGSDNNLVQLTDPAGHITRYGHDANNNLSSVTYPDGKTKTYHYEDSRFPHALTGITDENGVRYITYTYDSTGRAVGEVMAGDVESYGLNFGSNQTTVTDPLGTQRTYAFQTILGVAKSTGVSQPGGSGCGPASSALSYDGNGNVATRTDFNGNQTTYTYDLSRNLETKRVEASGQPESRTISTQWHSYWRQPVKLAEPKKLTTWVFNGDGGTYCAPQTATVPSINGGTQPIGVVCSKTEQATTDASGSSGFAATVTGPPRTWHYTYDTHGQILTADGPRTDVADVTTYTYYGADDPDMGKRGNLATLTNALGQVTHITAYDPHGNPLSLTDPNGMQTTLTYDLRQRLTSRTVGGETTTYQYDGVGQLIQITLPDGSHTTYTYDPAHRLTEIADALGNRIVYTLDAIGNRTKEEVKDPAGQLARTRSRIYDALSRLAQDIGAQGQATRYAYDANGNRTQVTDPLNQVTVSNYDALNRLIQVTDPGLGQTRYGWDGQDRLTQVTDPRNLVTTYALDGLGNRQGQLSPDTGSTTGTFDAAGNEITRTDAKGQVSTTLYDALNRPTRITYADGSATHYQWDQGSNGIGRLGAIEEYDVNGNRLRSIALSHDPQGRLTGETRTLGNVSHRIDYGYNNGQLTSLTLPSAKQLTYTRNAAGQITQVTLTANGQSKTLLQNIAYHPFGGVKHFTDGAGQLHSRSHDQDGRTSSYTLGGQTWLLSYDAASRITGLIDGGQAANSATYGYDALDRLTGASLPATAYAYAYDANGNRTAQSVGATTRVYTTAATSNQLQGLTNPARSLSHDANGSRTADGSQQYAYDVRGRLNQSITAAGTTHYQVNALGQRVGKRNGTSETLYHYDQAGRLLAESDAVGNLLREYVWLDDIPVAVLQ